MRSLKEITFRIFLQRNKAEEEGKIKAPNSFSVKRNFENPQKKKKKKKKKEKKKEQENNTF